jgi:hypothetical protein
MQAISKRETLTCKKGNTCVEWTPQNQRKGNPWQVPKRKSLASGVISYGLFTALS